VRAGRRRSALNEALHELRRPLQALSLLSARPAGAGTALDGSVQMAAAALARLDREINGTGPIAEPPVAEVTLLAARPLLVAAVARWQGRVALCGGSLDLRWEAGEVRVQGDRWALAQTLDNLIVNAIEHGGPQVRVAAELAAGRLRIAVHDSGRASRPPERRETPAELVGRLTGRRRRGHGLRVVRRTAAAHGGQLTLRCSEAGTAAVLELPLAAAEGAG
jgi:C4-dicarboxylate-specific signal transduction histidine kinase